MRKTTKKTTKKAGRPPGSTNRLRPRGQSKNITRLKALFDKYEIPGHVTDPVAYLVERGIANPIDLMALMKRLEWLEKAPRNLVALNNILCSLEARAGAKGATDSPAGGFLALVQAADDQYKRES